MDPAVSGVDALSHAEDPDDSDYYAVLLTSPCSSNSGCSSLTFVLSGFFNADSTAAPVKSWKIETRVASVDVVDGTGYIIDAIETGVLATPYIREGTLTELDISRVGDTVGTAMDLTIEFTLENGLDLGNDRVLISFPS